MAKHYLNPKQTTGPHDVETVCVKTCCGDLWSAYRLPFGKTIQEFKKGVLAESCATEAEALAAARKAAGYETEDTNGK